VIYIGCESFVSRVRFFAAVRRSRSTITNVRTSIMQTVMCIRPADRPEVDLHRQVSTAASMTDALLMRTRSVAQLGYFFHAEQYSGSPGTDMDGGRSVPGQEWKFGGCPPVESRSKAPGGGLCCQAPKSDDTFCKKYVIFESVLRCIRDYTNQLNTRQKSDTASDNVCPSRTKSRQPCPVGSANGNRSSFPIDRDQRATVKPGRHMEPQKNTT